MAAPAPHPLAAMWPARLAVALLLAGTVPLAASPARAEWLADAQGGLLYEDNLNRAARERDQKSDLALAPRLSVGPRFQLTDSTSLGLTADLRGSAYTEFTRFDNFAAGLTLGVREKLGLGLLAPWVRVFGSAAWLRYDDDVWDSSLLSAGLELGQRLHERLDLQVGYLYEARAANNAAIDSTGHTVSVRGSVLLAPATELTLGYATRWGDLTVTRRAAGPPPPRPSTVIETFDTRMFAFRIDATTYIASVALSQSLTRHWSLHVGYDYQFSQGPRLTYPNNVFRASFDYSF